MKNVAVANYSSKNIVQFKNITLTLFLVKQLASLQRVKSWMCACMWVVVC